MWLHKLIGISFQTLIVDLLTFYTVFFTLYILYRIARRIHYHYTKTFNFVMRTVISFFLAFLLVGTVQIVAGQDYFGQRVSVQHDRIYSLDSDRSFNYTTGTYGMYQVEGNHTFEQSVSLIGHESGAYLSGYAGWTYQSFVWQRLSLSATPLLDFDGYNGYFLDAQYLLTVPFGQSGFHADNVLGTKYFFDNNLNISYSPFVYYKWQTDSGLFFDLGPRSYLNTYQKRDPNYWSPRMFYQLGAGARLGLYGDPWTFVFDSFVGASQEKFEDSGNTEWRGNNNLYTSFRISHSFDNGFDLFGSATWASSRNIRSPLNYYSQATGNIGLAYNF